ncbi:AAA family ATPase [Micromonospora sp. WMMD708]|uniref:nSTAND1 domain-containing NTPase n=1 Tax=Micromonospora sp. WMMD708 TaxID=3403464 RepID=UPI003BF4CEB7
MTSIFFGFAINILTAETGNWWGPLQPLTRWPWIWVPASALFWVGWTWLDHHRSARTWASSENPYPGLAPFDSAHAGVFYGRDAEIGKITTRIHRSAVTPAGRFLVLVGPSGSGKSSIVRAGVLPALGKGWRVLGPMRPGADPFLALAQAVAPDDDVCTAGRLRDRHPGPVLRLVGSGQAVLVVDQLEDLFTLSSPEDRGAFVALLQAALTGHPSLSVLATMRPEYLAQAARLQQSLFSQPIPIGPLDTGHVREAIEQPAHAAGVAFEPGLVDAMVAEATMGDAMPLLALVLRRLYDAADRGVVTLASYDHLGRVSGAIADQADEVYRLAGQNTAVDATLLRFVGYENGEPIRRRVPRSVLDPVSMAVVEEFRNARLIVDVQDGQAFELAHDAIFRRWSVMSRLIDENRERLRRLTLLEQRAVDWAVSASADELLRGAALRQAVADLSEGITSGTITAYLDASVAAAEKEQSRIADGIAASARRLRHQDPELALALAATAVEEFHRSPAAGMTLWALTGQASRSFFVAGHSSPVLSVSWSPDGGMTTLDKVGLVCTWNSAGELAASEWLTSEPFRRDRANRDISQFYKRHMSPDGRHALVTSFDERAHVELWDIRCRHRLWRFAPEGRARRAWFCWIGNERFACSVGLNQLEVLELRDGTPHSLHTLDVASGCVLAGTADGTMLAAADSHRLGIWRLDSSGPAVCHSDTAIEEVLAVTWSPASDRLAVLGTQYVGDTDDLVEVHQLVEIHNPTGGEPIRWESPDCFGISWSPDGRLLAQITPTEVVISSPEDGTTDHRIRHAGSAETVHWSPCGSRIMVGRSDGAIAMYHRDQREWEVRPSGWLTTMDYHPTDRNTVVVAAHGVPRIVAPYPPHKALERFNRPSAVAWSPEGELIACIDGSDLCFWDPATGRIVSAVHLPEAVSGPALSWSPSGDMIALRYHPDSILNPSMKQSLIVWDVASRTTVSSSKLGSFEQPIAWRPGHPALAVASGSNVQLGSWCWKAADGVISALAWSSDGSRLAVSSNLALWLWNVDNATEIARCDLPTKHLCWSPDNGIFAAVSEQREIYLWDGMSGRELAILQTERRDDIADFSWPARLTMTFQHGEVLSWEVPQHDQPVIVPPGLRALTDAERQRYDVPSGTSAPARS